MAGEQSCSECGSVTKYKCITCDMFVCNRPMCSVAEKNEDIAGWVANSSVSYCNDCFFQTKPLSEDYELDDEDIDEEHGLNAKSKRKNNGRRSLWKSEYVDDMVDIITSSENFKRKLMFTNNKRATNGEVYSQVLEQIKERHALFPFTVKQMRTKFKWCISMCKKVALTIQTATGIKRFVEDKGYEQAIEPSTSTATRPTSSRSRSSSTGASSVDDLEDGEDKAEEDVRSNMFVPIRKNKNKNESEPVGKILKILETMAENDPTKELLNFMKEDAEKSRQSEMELVKLLASQNKEPPHSHVPQQTVPQEHFTFGPQQQYFEQLPPQHWGNQQHWVSHVPQEGQEINTYTKL
ncbi:Hypothetical predicted protein [Paramuricea clavata]|uniref:Uncharacterized protein n=1 Tax=Paramuricea clavata TaxID=317549 RepID=A0A7D9DFF0_PARCT|nr:Hypothetical predicted protein [Paramuricea clavata]